MARGKTAGRYSPSRRSRNQEDDSQRWLGTYGDAVTLLMAFFVMLYAMSQIDQFKFEMFVRGLEVPFGNTAIEQQPFDRSAAIIGEAPATDPDPITAVRPIPQQPVERVVVAPDIAQLERLKERIDASLAEESLDHLVSYQIDDRGLVVSIAADRVLFDTGSTVIQPVGRQIIATIADAVRDAPNDVLVEGHTDDVPIHRPDYTNWNLSTDRAVAVLSMLYQDFGLPQQRLGAVGYGEHRPAMPNDSPDNRAGNRRVDVLIVALPLGGITHG